MSLSEPIGDDIGAITSFSALPGAASLTGISPFHCDR